VIGLIQGKCLRTKCTYVVHIHSTLNIHVHVYTPTLEVLHIPVCVPVYMWYRYCSYVHAY